MKGYLLCAISLLYLLAGEIQANDGFYKKVHLTQIPIPFVANYSPGSQMKPYKIIYVRDQLTSPPDLKISLQNKDGVPLEILINQNSTSYGYRVRHVDDITITKNMTKNFGTDIDVRVRQTNKTGTFEPVTSITYVLVDGGLKSSDVYFGGGHYDHDESIGYYKTQNVTGFPIGSKIAVFGIAKDTFGIDLFTDDEKDFLHIFIVSSKSKEKTKNTVTVECNTFAGGTPHVYSKESILDPKNYITDNGKIVQVTIERKGAKIFQIKFQDDVYNKKELPGTCFIPDNIGAALIVGKTSSYPPRPVLKLYDFLFLFQKS